MITREPKLQHHQRPSKLRRLQLTKLTERASEIEELLMGEDLIEYPTIDNPNLLYTTRAIASDSSTIRFPFETPVQVVWNNGIYVVRAELPSRDASAEVGRDFRSNPQYTAARGLAFILMQNRVRIRSSIPEGLGSRLATNDI